MAWSTICIDQLTTHKEMDKAGVDRDRDFRNVLKLLNTYGAITSYSCQGHKNDPHPYIAFNGCLTLDIYALGEDLGARQPLRDDVIYFDYPCDWNKVYKRLEKFLENFCDFCV